MSTETSTRGDRTTCDECGLPYYADENDACPYCEHATQGAQPSSTPTGPEPGPADTNAANARPDETDPSFIRRVSERVRKLLSSG
jgi:uncharacterized Zn finger protein (UPF0148 family)